MADAGPSGTTPQQTNTTNEHRDGLKLAKPAPFDGSRANYRSFIFGIGLYLEATAPEASDARKILFTLSYMTGGLAINWKNQYIQKMSDGKGRTYDWTVFLKDMDKTFTDTHAEATARAKLQGLKQNKDQAADEYFVEFERLAIDADYDTETDKHLIEILQDNIHDAIIDQIWRSGEIPDDYEGWKTRIIRIDSAYRQRQERRKHKWGAKPWQPNNNKGRQDSAGKKDKPQVDEAAKAYGYTGQPGEPMKTDRRKGKGAAGKKCYGCGKEGHFARDCRSNPDTTRARELKETNDEIEKLREQIRRLQGKGKEKEEKEEKDDESEQDFD